MNCFINDTKDSIPKEYAQAVSTMKDWSLSAPASSNGNGKSFVGFLTDYPSLEDVKFRTPFAPESWRGKFLDLILDLGVYIKATGERLSRQNILFDYSWPIAPGAANHTASRIGTVATCCDFNLQRLRNTIGTCGLVICPGELAFATACMLQDCFCPSMNAVFSFGMNRPTISTIVPAPIAGCCFGADRYTALWERAKWIIRRIIRQSSNLLIAPRAFE